MSLLFVVYLLFKLSWPYFLQKLITQGEGPKSHFIPWLLYAINQIARAMAFALESPDKKIRERVYEHFKNDKFRKFFEI